MCYPYSDSCEHVGGVYIEHNMSYYSYPIDISSYIFDGLLFCMSEYDIDQHVKIVLLDYKTDVYSPTIYMNNNCSLIE